MRLFFSVLLISESLKQNSYMLLPQHGSTQIWAASMLIKPKPYSLNTLKMQKSPDYASFGHQTFCLIQCAMSEHSILSTASSACSKLNHTPSP